MDEKMRDDLGRIEENVDKFRRLLAPNLIEKFPYISASKIELESKTFGGESGMVATVWIASVNAASHDGTMGFKNYGPRVSMSAYGDTAREALEALEKALSEQGWVVR